MKKVPFILMICTLLVSSCFYLRMYHFCEGDLEWMSPYEQGDTILFKSHEQIDTMIVQEKSIYDSSWPLMKDESSSTMNATGVLSNIILHNGDSVTNSFSITKRENNRLRIGLFFEYKGMFCDVPSGITFCKVKVNGIVLEDAILVDDTVSSEKVKKQQSCEYFIWSKSKGLIQYKYLNGDTYTFYKKLPYKVTHTVLIIGYDRNKQSEYRCMDPWNDSSQNGRYIYYNASRFRDVYRFK